MLGYIDKNVVTKTRVMGTEKNLWKSELDPIICLDSTGIWSLKRKEIKGSGAMIKYSTYLY